MRRFCNHKYADNRCIKCSAWKRGCKPACEPVRPRDECQICERKQSLVQGTLGHHGYTRPGYGYIQGDCFGVGYAPYPAVDALIAYNAHVEEYIRRCESSAIMTTTATELTYFYACGKEKHSKILTPDWTGGYENRRCIPSFTEHKAAILANLESQIRMAKFDLVRITARIAAAAT
jgi:hypothetical protein